MKITVCSMENRTGDSLYEFTHKNHEEYCLKNGYEYYEVNDFSKYEKRPTPHWHKFDAIFDALKNSDWVLWIDFDAYFTNFDVRIETFIDSDYSIIMSKDCKGERCLFDTGFNDGVILLKNCAPVLDLCLCMKNQKNVETFHDMYVSGRVKLHDQSGLTYFLELSDYKKLVKEIPAKSFNSYVQKRALMENEWEKGDFILHLAGFTQEQRARILKEKEILK